jgi:Zn-dependent protease with chaperone function
MKNIWLFTKSRDHGKIEDNLIVKLSPICKYAGIRMPIIVISSGSSCFKYQSSYFGFPIYRNVLSIPEGTCRQLTDEGDRIIALLAHEIGHAKNHALKYRLQYVLSELSLMGGGFLNILNSSFEIEFEADKFAVEYLGSIGKNASCLISLLEEIQDWEKNNAIRESSHVNDIGRLNFAMTRHADYRENLLMAYDNAGPFRKYLISIKLFCQMCFGNEVLSYLHPPIEERIKRIKSYGQ